MTLAQVEHLFYAPGHEHHGAVLSAVWGVDLGVRSLYVARLEGRHLDTFSIALKIRQHSRPRELRILHDWLADTLGPGEVWIEEPPLAGARNLQTFLKLGQVSGVVAAAAGGDGHLVPVSSWKLGTVGNGSASKDLVARWLYARHPGHSQACAGDQNLIDATCIALHGQAMGAG